MTSSLVLEVASGPVTGRVAVPGSKSIANRALVCAALAEGPSHLHHVATGDDTLAMIDCLRAFGIGIDVLGDGLVVTGAGGHLRGGGTLDARLAGTTSRFVTAVAALATDTSVVTGGAPLRNRPMAPLHDALRSLGARVESVDEPGHLPVRVSGGRISGGTVQLPGDISSQYVSALMLIAPLMDQGLTIQLTSPLVSRPYVAITAAVMSSFGASGIAIGDRLVSVEPGAYVAVDYSIEADASSASYPLAAAAITGGRVTVAGLGSEALQGDAVFADVLGSMGCVVERDATSTTVSESVSRGIEIDMADMSDLVPTLAAVAAFAPSPTRITGVGFIRVKESDRIGDLVRGLRALGVDAREESDGLTVVPGGTLHGANLRTHDDHRLAMAWSLLALRVPGIVIDDASVVAKSWPSWWDVRSSLLEGSSR